MHAYLLVGPRGSGVEEAARCFAAALITTDTSSTEDDERSWDLVLRGVHPDVVEIDPPATQIRIEDAQAVVEEVSRSPIEGERKVVMLFDAERLRLNEAAANKLLKTLEEPPPRAVIILVTSGADQLLPTIRSRCQRVDFAYLGADAVAAALITDGIPADRADLLARLAGGRIDRARRAQRSDRPSARRLRHRRGIVRRHRRRGRTAGRAGPGRIADRALRSRGGAGRGDRAARRRARGRGLPRAHADTHNSDGSKSVTSAHIAGRASTHSSKASPRSRPSTATRWRDRPTSGSTSIARSWL